MVTNDYSLTDGSIPQTETFPLLTIFHFSRWSPLVLCYMNSNIIFHYQYIGINSTANKSFFSSAEPRAWLYTVAVRPYPQAMSGVGTFLCFSSPSYTVFLYNTRLITFRNFPLFFIRFLSITETISQNVMVSDPWLEKKIYFFENDLRCKYFVHLKFKPKWPKFNQSTLRL